jgi:hypothetical protein
MPKVSKNFKNIKTYIHYIKIKFQYFEGEREFPQSVLFMNHHRMSHVKICYNTEA